MSTTISAVNESAVESNKNINKGGTTVIYPESFWRDHIETYLTSGYNKSQYCRQHDLVYHRFLHWCRKFAKSEGNAISGNNSFIPVKLKSTPASSNCICTLELSNGNRLLIHDETALQLLLSKLLK